MALSLLSVAAAFAQAVIKFDKNVYDFGTFTKSQRPTVEAVFTNEGNKPLAINQVLTSCGCTAAQFTKDPVNPDEKGKITLVFDGKKGGFTNQEFRKKVTVISTASNRYVTFVVKGFMTDGKK